MGLIHKDTFICLDCEATGLDTENDAIIELAAVKFTYDGVLDKTETLINPERPIPDESQKIHNISDAMVLGKPTIKEALPNFLEFVGDHLIVGHGIIFDLLIIHAEAKKACVPCKLSTTHFIDTLRLARLYGESPSNSLQKLREHFNIPMQGAHRAMNDVVVNIDVFKYLSRSFKTTEDLINRLKKPIAMKAMPLGKHKGRPFNEIPIEYLLWAGRQDFDQDLLFSIRSELKKRKKGNPFNQAANPFAEL